MTFSDDWGKNEAVWQLLAVSVCFYYCCVVHKQYNTNTAQTIHRCSTQCVLHRCINLVISNFFILKV